MDLSKTLRVVPDWPKRGIQFYDVTTLIKQPAALKEAIRQMAAKVEDIEFDKVMGIESRGFVFGTGIALESNKSLILARKPGKLPAKTVAEGFMKEYGPDSIEVHEDAISEGDRVLIVDDLLATGGTILAAAKLVEKLGGKVAGFLFLIDLTSLHGKLPYPVRSVLEFEVNE